MGDIRVKFTARQSWLETIPLPVSLLSVSIAQGTNKRKNLHVKKAMSEHWCHCPALKSLYLQLCLHFQLFLAKTTFFETNTISFCFPVESTATKGDEKSNKVDFFYRWGTQTGMIVQGIQDNTSFVAHSTTGDILASGLFCCVKYSKTGFAK